MRGSSSTGVFLEAIDVFADVVGTWMLLKSRLAMPLGKAVNGNSILHETYDAIVFGQFRTGNENYIFSICIK